CDAQTRHHFQILPGGFDWRYRHPILTRHNDVITAQRQTQPFTPALQPLQMFNRAGTLGGHAEKSLIDLNNLKIQEFQPVNDAPQPQRLVPPTRIAADKTRKPAVAPKQTPGIETEYYQMATGNKHSRRLTQKLMRIFTEVEYVM